MHARPLTSKDRFDGLPALEIAGGQAAFAKRARRELRATGETARKRSAPAQHHELMAQEAWIARMARDGLSNPGIGARCLSARAPVLTGSYLPGVRYWLCGR
jgi:hypothetical protein